MIDRSFGAYGQSLRAPDLRLGDVRTEIFADRPPFELRIDDPGRSFFFYVLKGTFLLEIEGASRPPIRIAPGSAIGSETGRAQRWCALTADRSGAKPDQSVELFVSSIPGQLGVLRQLDDGLVIIAPDAEPYASVLRHTVEIHASEARNLTPDSDDLIIRRCAEIVLLQFIRYARSKTTAQPDRPAGLARDEHILRVWSAFFSDPRRRWTIQTLAAAAGLGRTAFIERFHRIFGGPPLQTLTQIRLEQAADMLRHGNAPLIQIAFFTGYNSEAAFVRAFHRNYGVPPGRFRAEHNQNRSSDFVSMNG